MNPILTTIVYCLEKERVLLIERKKSPFAGHWVAPGGKIETGEWPYECAIRELSEETGLLAVKAELRAIISETSPRSDWQWLIFAYLVTEFRRSFEPDKREGQAAWWSLGELDSLKVPEADRIFCRKVFDVQNSDLSGQVRVR